MKTFFKLVGILILIIIFFPLAWNKIDTIIAVNKYKPQENVEVPLGQKFSLKEGGKAHIKDTNSNINVTLLEGGNCGILSIITGCGVNIGYRISLNLEDGDNTYKFFGHEMQNAVYAEDKPFVSPYKIIVGETDYKNYVNLMIIKK